MCVTIALLCAKKRKRAPAVSAPDQSPFMFSLQRSSSRRTATSRSAILPCSQSTTPISIPQCRCCIHACTNRSWQRPRYPLALFDDLVRNLIFFMAWGCDGSRAPQIKSRHFLILMIGAEVAPKTSMGLNSTSAH